MTRGSLAVVLNGTDGDAKLMVMMFKSCQSEVKEWEVMYVYILPFI